MPDKRKINKDLSRIRVDMYRYFADFYCKKKRWARLGMIGNSEVAYMFIDMLRKLGYLVDVDYYLDEG